MKILCKEFIRDKMTDLCFYKFRGGDNVFCGKQSRKDINCPHNREFMSALQRVWNLDDIKISTGLSIQCRRGVNNYLNLVRWNKNVTLDEAKLEIYRLTSGANQ